MEEYAVRNREQSQRLKVLTDAAPPERLRTALCGAWPASAVLGHLAFWDRRAAWILREWRAGWEPPDDPEWYRTDDLLNDSLAPIWAALPPAEAVRLAIEAASEVDAEVEATLAVLAAEVMQTGRDWLLNRWRHRAQHLNEIEQALRT